MRSGLALCLALLSLAATTSARAEDAESCPVPASLLSTESSLTKVADAVESGHPLAILVVGSRSSSINGSDDSAYPARLQVALKEKFPAATGDVSV